MIYLKIFPIRFFILLIHFSLSPITSILIFILQLIVIFFISIIFIFLQNFCLIISTHFHML